jgi:hypothetical protein
MHSHSAFGESRYADWHIPVGDDLQPEMMHTACYRGFYLGYSLTKNGVFLRRIKVRDSRGL